MLQVKHIVLCTALFVSVHSNEMILWRDEFEGTELDSSKWCHDLGSGEWGWGNGELQVFTEESVEVKEGNLVITAEQTGENTFTSGRLKTTGKMVFQYGKVEARVMLPNVVEGLWPAIWTLGYNNEEVEWPECGELDMIELGQGLGLSEGVGNSRVVSSAHWVDYEGYASYGLHYDASYDLNGTYHIYTMNWTPECVTTYIDGQQIWKMDINPAVCQGCEELHQPHVLLMKLAVGGAFTVATPSAPSASSTECGGSSSTGSSSVQLDGGCAGVRRPDDITTPLPAQMIVDYVRIIDNGYTVVETTGVYSPPQEAEGVMAPPVPMSAPAPTQTTVVEAVVMPPPVPAFVPAEPIQTTVEEVTTTAPVSPSVLPAPAPVSSPVEPIQTPVEEVTTAAPVAPPVLPTPVHVFEEESTPDVPVPVAVPTEPLESTVEGVATPPPVPALVPIPDSSEDESSVAPVPTPPGYGTTGEVPVSASVPSEPIESTVEQVATPPPVPVFIPAEPIQSTVEDVATAAPVVAPIHSLPVPVSTDEATSVGVPVCVSGEVVVVGTEEVLHEPGVTLGDTTGPIPLSAEDETSVPLGPGSSGYGPSQSTTVVEELPESSPPPPVSSEPIQSAGLGSTSVPDIPSVPVSSSGSSSSSSGKGGKGSSSSKSGKGGKGGTGSSGAGSQGTGSQGSGSQSTEITSTMYSDRLNSSAPGATTVGSTAALLVAMALL